MVKSKVSVIVPIYKVERFIERCVVSLMEQTLDEVEYIFVDDASPDGSVKILHEVIARYPNRAQNIKIITHSENKGLPAARNTGLAEVTGEYVFHCDSDDSVELEMLETLYAKAKSEDADIVWCDFYMDYGNRLDYCRMFKPDNIDEIQRLKSYLSYGWNVLWNMIVKKDIYKDNKIRGYEGFSFTEDFGVTARLLFYAKKVVYVPQALYFYNRTNQSSIVYQELSSKKRAQMINDEITICSNIISFYKQKGVYDFIKQEMLWRILKAKRGWLYDSKKWIEYNNLYPESNSYIKNNPFCSKKDMLCQFLIINKYLRPLLYIIKLIDKIYRKLR